MMCHEQNRASKSEQARSRFLVSAVENSGVWAKNYRAESKHWCGLERDRGVIEVFSIIFSCSLLQTVLSVFAWGVEETNKRTNPFGAGHGPNIHKPLWSAA